MEDSVGEQKLLLVGSILDLQEKLKTLEYILDEAKESENKVTFEFFDELFNFIYSLLWESLVINIGWIFHKKAYEKNKKQNRSLYWYLEQLRHSKSVSENEINDYLKRLDNLTNEVDKVLKVRDKWVANRDKKAFENPDKYLKEVGLKLADVKILIKTAMEIIREKFPVTDLTSSGIHKLFWVIEYSDMLPKKIEEIKQKQKFAEIRN
jgi:soluble cytochrome b562